MSNTNQTVTTQTNDTTVVQVTQPVKRGRGRPKGSKNKPKTNGTVSTTTKVSHVPSEVNFEDLA